LGGSDEGGKRRGGKRNGNRKGKKERAWNHLTCRMARRNRNIDKKEQEKRPRKTKRKIK